MLWFYVSLFVVTSFFSVKQQLSHFSKLRRATLTSYPIRAVLPGWCHSWNFWSPCSAPSWYAHYFINMYCKLVQLCIVSAEHFWFLSVGFRFLLLGRQNLSLPRSSTNLLSVFVPLWCSILHCTCYLNFPVLLKLCKVISVAKKGAGKSNEFGIHRAHKTNKVYHRLALIAEYFFISWGSAVSC